MEDIKNVKVNQPEILSDLQPNQKLLKYKFQKLYGIDLTQEQLLLIEAQYHTIYKEHKKDICIYRGINLVLFFLLFILAFIFTGSWVFRISLSFFIFYNAVHLWINLKSFKQL